jgi:hypothetical protein
LFSRGEGSESEEAHVTEALPNTGPELVRYYNERAEKIGAPLVKRFASVAAGRSRCEKIDAAAREKEKNRDIIPAEAEPVSAASAVASKGETTTEEERVMSTSVQEVSYAKHIVNKKIEGRKGPRFNPNSLRVKLTEALLKKAMTKKEMARLMYPREKVDAGLSKVGNLWNGIRWEIGTGYLRLKIDEKENSDGETTYRLLRK